MKTNELILAERSASLDKKTGIRVGDYLKLSNGQYLRFSHDWGDAVQTSKSVGDSSFYLGNEGCSFSGSLYPAIEKAKITQIQETKLGSVWFFKNDYHTAHNGSSFEIPFRVFELTDKDFEKSYINTWLSN
jgi:hypothetical protein